MDIFAKKELILTNIKRFDANYINPNDVMLCNTDEDLLKLILQSSPNYWFNNYVLTLDQFVDFFSYLFEQYNIFTTGEHRLYGHHKGYAFGDAVLYVYNDYELHAYQKATVYAYTQSRIFTHDFVKAEAHNLSCVDMFGVNCQTKYFEESGGNVHNGIAYTYDKSFITMMGGTLEASNNSKIKTTGNDCKNILAMDNVMLDLHGRTIAKCYNNCRVKSYDLSEVICHNFTCVESYDKSCITLYDSTSCIAHDRSVIHICAAKCVKLLDCAIGYNTHDIAIQMDVCGTSYLCDLTDTFTQVQNNGTIKWWQSGEIFSNQIK